MNRNREYRLTLLDIMIMTSTLSLLLPIAILIVSVVIVLSVQSPESISIQVTQRQCCCHFRHSSTDRVIDTTATTSTTKQQQRQQRQHQQQSAPFHLHTSRNQRSPLPLLLSIIPPNAITRTVSMDSTTMFPFPKIPFHTMNRQIQNIIFDRQTKQNTITFHIHCIVLVHGWMGNSKELSYLQSRLIEEAATISSSNNVTTTTTSTNIPICLVYSSIINEGKTNDGIVSGGQRLAYEINQWMKEIREQIVCEQLQLQQQQQESNSIQKYINYNLSLSMIGNSLGGLYARYALRDIQFQFHGTTNSANGMIHDIYPAVFCTTCTPHLGVGATHLFIPNIVPLWIQTIIAKIIGPTGIDLFRVPNRTKHLSSSSSSSSQHPPVTSTTTSTWDDNNSSHDNNEDIIQQMTFRKEYVIPLQNFHRRIALCNTYRTDFQVPCSTAAFLMSSSSSSSASSTNWNQKCEDSNYYHVSKKWYIDALNIKQQYPNSCISLIADTATTYIQTNNNDENAPSTILSNQLPVHPIATSNELAYQLDSLGWMKIFCDVRPYLPFIPTNIIHVVLISTCNFIKYLCSLFLTTKMSPSYEQSNSNTTIPSTTNVVTHGNYSSKDIWKKYIADEDHRNTHKNRWYIPFGHTLVIANAKNEWYSQLNMAGRPTMDHLATILIHEIIQT
jgi:Putative serine esterase (DUF676)